MLQPCDSEYSVHGESEDGVVSLYDLFADLGQRSGSGLNGKFDSVRTHYFWQFTAVFRMYVLVTINF